MYQQYIDGVYQQKGCGKVGKLGTAAAQEQTSGLCVGELCPQPTLSGWPGLGSGWHGPLPGLSAIKTLILQQLVCIHSMASCASCDHRCRKYSVQCTMSSHIYSGWILYCEVVL